MQRLTVARFQLAVATLVRSADMQRLAGLLSDYYRVLTANSWASLEAIIRSQPLCAAVIDPTFDSAFPFEVAASVVQKYSSLPFIAYVHVDGESIRAVARLARIGLSDVILAEDGDAAHRVEQNIQLCAPSFFSHAVLRELEPRLAGMPAGIARTVRSLFVCPERFSSAGDIADEAAVTTTYLYRCFKSAGLSSPKKFLMAARVLHGCGYLVDRQFSVEHVAIKCGYPSARAFARHVRGVLGQSPSTLRSVLEDEEPRRQLSHILTDTLDRR